MYSLIATIIILCYNQWIFFSVNFSLSLSLSSAKQPGHGVSSIFEQRKSRSLWSFGQTFFFFFFFTTTLLTALDLNRPISFIFHFSPISAFSPFIYNNFFFFFFFFPFYNLKLYYLFRTIFHYFHSSAWPFCGNYHYFLADFLFILWNSRSTTLFFFFSSWYLISFSNSCNYLW